MSERFVVMARKIPPRYADFKMDGVTDDESFDCIRSYLADFNACVHRGVGLLLAGPNGSGKTGALAAVHNSLKTLRPQWGSKEKIWCKAHDIATMYNYGAVDSTFDETVDDLCNEAPWMVVDELGRESNVANFDRRMQNLLRTRYDNKLITCFTTNLSLEQIKAMYGEGFWSLLHDCCIISTVKGQDRRRTGE